MARLFFIIIGVTLASCGGKVISVAECGNANWFDIGKRDASEGRSYEVIGDYARICKGAQVTPDQNQYVQGYRLGAEEYCNYDNGYERGKKGGKAFEMCKSGSDYHLGYGRGIKEYAEEAERRKLERLTRISSGTGVGAATDAGNSAGP